ncbi:MAG: hypothetical protein DRR16_20715 [Candidatus Parabeggiatoa sp. nov. 3]|mgnify:CR=1 FL=1|jgi:hypothetical protein|nr:MAG: hypothetical protein DRR00_18430 [Gammaproteobacteria bacterium]RKZ64703.1 MAG: hypothetical protein DRQ99_14925 [Gammaproteobacteria bacterium]RKZ82018.1 MAG: hypothetical protein DRR16_20715 [Gammaproteobacteria bacterium]
MIENIYTINAGALFDALNAHRKSKALTEIDNPLIASKLGILFALKTNGYVNFKGEYVELNDAQLIALQEILDQHFNAEMIDEIRALVITQEQLQISQVVEIRRRSSSLQADNNGFFNKIKGFLKMKSKILEEPA